jgi:hypothetical protein
VNVTWFGAIIAVVFLALGLTMLFARKGWAGSIARRRDRLYPSGVRRVLSIQESPIYFLVVGIVFTLIGLFFALGTIGSVIRRG